MAQVTMDSKEYLELIATQRELEQIKKDMVAGFSFKYDADSYQNYRCKFGLVIPEDVKERIIAKVLNECINTPEMMQACWQNNLTVFNLSTMQLSMHWSSMESYEVDLMEYPDFQVAYNKYEELNIAEEQEEE